MRILNVTQSYEPFFEFGGPPAKVLALSEGLAKMGHEVTVLTADWSLEKRLKNEPGAEPTEDSPFGRRRRKNGVTAIYLANWLQFRALSWNPALPRYLRARLAAFDIIHIFGLYDILGVRVAAASRLQGIPYVVEPMGMFLPIVRNIVMKRLYHRALGRSMLAGASAVIATSEQERAELISGGVPAEKIALRRNGVDEPANLPPYGIFRDSFQIPRAVKLILFLGRLSLKKSPELLLEAFAKLTREDYQRSDSPHLVFVGPDESGTLEKLQEMSARLSLTDSVHFVGPISGQTKWAAYRDADIFVLPSQNENFGNTAAESIAAGTPVIVTEQCGIAPLVAGTAGLVARHDAVSIADALNLLLHDENLYRTLKAGCSTTMRRLGWAEPLQELNALFSRLARSDVQESKN
jgi:glycosyltransferase involved in cell wall biosynthesis